MVDYSKWDRLDLGDSDSDAGEAEGARKSDALREALFADMISLAMKKEAAGVDAATYGPAPPPILPRENTNSAEKTDRVCNERQLRGKSKGKASNIASNDEAANSLHGGSQLTATGSSETIRYDNGTYVGEVKEGVVMHGKGVYSWNVGAVYDGDWKDHKKHGRGTYKYANGDVYDGEFVAGKRHGKGAMKYATGNVYEGQFVDGKVHGKGITTNANGDEYEGEFLDGKMHGWGTETFKSGGSYEGEWVAGKKHGKGTMKYPSGEIWEGIWREGDLAIEDVTNHSPPGCSATGESSLPECGAPGERRAKENRAFSRQRLTRSQRSQQRRLQNNTAVRKCGHCGVDDHQFKLQVCSGCNLALFCTPACQKAANRSHRRICDIVPMLPSKDSDRLVLEYDKDKLVDLDAGLRYGTKYMTNLKHLTMNVREMVNGDALRLSTKQLSSLLKSKKGALESVFLLQRWAKVMIPGISINSDDNVWKELHGLKQLRLCYMMFKDVHHVCDIICQQQDTLIALCLPFLGIPWHMAKCRRAIAQAVNSCKHLVRLNLSGCLLMDADLKIVLNDRPNLRVLCLKRDTDYSHEFTDNTCGLIARKCPGLQELDLDHHNQLSVRGIRKIFEGCIQLRSFYTTTRKLSGKDIQRLLGIAPQLMYLSLELDISEEELDQIIEATGGRTVLQLNNTSVFAPMRVSVNTRKMYECQKVALNEIWSNAFDPADANEWDGCLMGPLPRD